MLRDEVNDVAPASYPPSWSSKLAPLAGCPEGAQGVEGKEGEEEEEEEKGETDFILVLLFLAWCPGCCLRSTRARSRLRTSRLCSGYMFLPRSRRLFGTNSTQLLRNGLVLVVLMALLHLSLPRWTSPRKTFLTLSGLHVAHCS